MCEGMRVLSITASCERACQRAIPCATSLFPHTLSLSLSLLLTFGGAQIPLTNAFAKQRSLTHTAAVWLSFDSRPLKVEFRRTPSPSGWPKADGGKRQSLPDDAMIIFSSPAALIGRCHRSRRRLDRRDPGLVLRNDHRRPNIPKSSYINLVPPHHYI